MVRGTEISSFAVEIVDVVSGDASANDGPRILVRVSGPVIDETGVGPASRAPRSTAATAGHPPQRRRDLESIGAFGGKTVLATPIEETSSTPEAPAARPIGARSSRLGPVLPLCISVSIDALHGGSARAAVLCLSLALLGCPVQPPVNDDGGAGGGGGGGAMGGGGGATGGGGGGGGGGGNDDAGSDAGLEDSGVIDAGVDAGVDAWNDAGTDAGTDAGIDAGVNAVPSAGPKEFTRWARRTLVNSTNETDSPFPSTDFMALPDVTPEQFGPAFFDGGRLATAGCASSPSNLQAAHLRR